MFHFYLYVKKCTLYLVIQIRDIPSNLQEFCKVIIIIFFFREKGCKDQHEFCNKREQGNYFKGYCVKGLIHKHAGWKLYTEMHFCYKWFSSCLTFLLHMTSDKTKERKVSNQSSYKKIKFKVGTRIQVSTFSIYCHFLVIFLRFSMNQIFL